MAKREVAVRVVVRVRPLLEGERLQGRGEIEECVKVVSQKQLVLGGEHSFTFDRVLLPESSQADAYHKCTAPLVHSALEGFNATLLAYGQTGSGKTYALGSGAEMEWNGEKEGMIPRALNDVFKALQSLPGVLSHTVRVSYVEVYKEELRDLLDSGTAARKTLQLREQENGNIVVHGLMEVEVNSANEALSWLQSGNVARITGSTNMNQRSSRSHAIFTLHIEHVKLLSPTSSTSSSLGPQQHSSVASSPSGKQSAASESRPMNSHHHRVTSKFHFVDLAGSERVDRTGNRGERFKESIHINSGLLALGNVISALGEPKRKSQHVPYRDSKITRLLKDSLGGNTKTVMLACLSPAASNYAETLNTLKYAQRARHIKNKPVVNLDQQVQEMEHMRTEIAALREELSRTRSIAPPSSAPPFSALPSSTPLSPPTRHPLVGVEVVELKQKVAQLEEELERCQLDLATDEEMFAERELELAGLQEQVSTLTAEKTHLQKKVSGYAEREQTLQEEVLQLTHQVTQLERELSAGREKGEEQLTAEPVDETTKQDAVQRRSTTRDGEGPVSDNLEQEKESTKLVLDFSLQSLLSSLSARNDRLAAEVMKHSKPLSGTWSMGKSDHKQCPSQQDEFEHHRNHHSNQHLQDHQQQQTVGGSSVGVFNQMRSLREKEAVVEEHLEGMVQRRRALEQLERELVEREQSLAEREAALAERDMLDVKRLRASQTAHKEWVRASMKLSAVESSISEREAVWREGGGPAVQHNQGAQLRTLQGERESLLKEVRGLQERVKLDSFLSLEEERRLAELSEWVDVMDAALEYRRRQFGARQKRSVLSSLEQKGGGVSEVLKVLTLEDTRHLMVVYLNKLAGLKLKLEDAEQLNQECRLQLKEKDDLVSTLERCLRHCRSELQRRLALQEREHRRQLEAAARGEGQEGGAGKSLLEGKVHELERELYYYKKTSRDLKKRLRAHVQGDHQGQPDPLKGPPRTNAAAQSMKGEDLQGASTEESQRVSQSQPKPIGREERVGGTATASAQSDVSRVFRKSKKELRQLSAEEVTRRIKGTSLAHN